jgi:DNA-binding MarR family transcriptional regulator
MSSQVLIPQASSALDAWVRLLRGHAAATRAMSADLVAEHGLTINDYEALLHLSRAENAHMRRVDLAELLLLTPSGVTRLLEGLERAGWVEKATCSSDARVTYAVLTDEGRGKLESASRSHIAQVRTLFEDRFSQEELATLANLLARLPGAAGADAGDCSAERT